MFAYFVRSRRRPAIIATPAVITASAMSALLESVPVLGRADAVVVVVAATVVVVAATVVVAGAMTVTDAADVLTTAHSLGLRFCTVTSRISTLTEYVPGLLNVIVLVSVTPLNPLGREMEFDNTCVN